MVLYDGGDAFEGTVAVGKTSQGRDSPRGLQLVEEPCWGRATTKKPTAGEPCRGRAVLRSKKQRKENK